MVLTLPNGSYKYYRPAPQDLASAWTVIEEIRPERKLPEP
jgi:hypothetical protein